MLTTLFSGDAEGARLRACVDMLPADERFVAERIHAWSELDLVEAVKQHLVVDPKNRADRILRLSTAIGGKDGEEAALAHQRLRAAHRVGGLVERRWYAAGFRWARGFRGLPVPLALGARCRFRYSHQVSPSGKAMFACPSCDARPTPLPPPEAPECAGREPGRGLASAVADVLVAGGRFDLGRVFRNEEGVRALHFDLPLPADGPELRCGRCGVVGAWTGRLPASYQEPDHALCPGCVLAPPWVYRGDQRAKRGA